jgi:hypothetical protein
MKTLLLAFPLLFATPAIAKTEVTVGCGLNNNGYRICYENHGEGGKDLLLIKGPLGTEYIRLVCKKEEPIILTSTGPNSTKFVNEQVTDWCKK